MQRTDHDGPFVVRLVPHLWWRAINDVGISQEAAAQLFTDSARAVQRTNALAAVVHEELALTGANLLHHAEQARMHYSAGWNSDRLVAATQVFNALLQQHQISSAMTHAHAILEPASSSLERRFASECWDAEFATDLVNVRGHIVLSFARCGRLDAAAKFAEWFELVAPRLIAKGRHVTSVGSCRHRQRDCVVTTLQQLQRWDLVAMLTEGWLHAAVAMQETSFAGLTLPPWRTAVQAEAAGIAEIEVLTSLLLQAQLQLGRYAAAVALMQPRLQGLHEQALAAADGGPDAFAHRLRLQWHLSTVGFAAMGAGEYEAAVSHFDGALALCQARVQLTPDQRWILETQRCALVFAQGRCFSAMQHYSAAVRAFTAVATSIAASSQTNSHYQLDQAQAMHWSELITYELAVNKLCQYDERNGDQEDTLARRALMNVIAALAEALPTNRSSNQIVDLRMARRHVVKAQAHALQGKHAFADTHARAAMRMFSKVHVMTRAEAAVTPLDASCPHLARLQVAAHAQRSHARCHNWVLVHAAAAYSGLVDTLGTQHCMVRKARGVLVQALSVVVGA